MGEDFGEGSAQRRYRRVHLALHRVGGGGGGSPELGREGKEIGEWFLSFPSNFQ